MGTFASTPSGRYPKGDDCDTVETKLGDALAGEFADVDVDSVESVREIREEE